MEQLTHRHAFTAEQINTLEYVGVLSPYINCSHRRYPCLIKGQCCLQQFTYVVDRLNEDGQRHEIDALNETYARWLADRENVWITLQRMVREEGVISTDKSRTSLVEELSRRFVEYGVQDRFNDLRYKKRPARVVVDEEKGAAHLFCIPMWQGNLSTIFEVTRFRRIAAVVYDGDMVDSFASPLGRRSDDILQRIRRRVHQEIPNCPRTGEHGCISHVIFISSHQRAILERGDETDTLFRIAESDAKMLRAHGSCVGERIAFQRYAVSNGGVEAVLNMFLTNVPTPRGNMSLCMYMAQTPTDNVHNALFPLLIHKSVVLDGLACDMVFYFLAGTERCCGCFLKSHGVQHISVIHTRLGDHNANPVMRARIANHKVTNKEIQDMGYKESLITLNEHCFGVTCLDVSEAIILSMVEMQKRIRGDGHWGVDSYTDAIISLFRTYVHWNPQGRDRIIMFRLICFCIFGAAPGQDGRFCDWDNYDRFADVINNGCHPTPETERVAHSLLLKFGVEAMRCVDVVPLTALDTPVVAYGPIVEMDDIVSQFANMYYN
uniref:Non-structural protein NS1 n=1 Tax=Equine encephalosis virus 4 TaxID=201494 RepID=A0A7U1GE63_9REOV|nr:NS1 protein [Equine encephalosis virus]QQY96607.1 NS1 [Equine encephalosis virus 4]